MASRVIIRLRIDHRTRALFDGAAQAAGKSRSEFILDAACREAAETLLDRTFFHLDGETFSCFVAALDRSPMENPRLGRLLASKPCWE